MSDAENARVDWPEYFMRIAFMVAERSTCVRRHVGCVLVRDKRILTTGYNGAPSGTAHCADIGCLRAKYRIRSGERHELCRGVHAEQNAIIQAAISGTSVRGAEVYCTTFPCFQCAKMLVNCGVKRIYYCDEYSDAMSAKMLEEAGVTACQLERK